MDYRTLRPYLRRFLIILAVSLVVVGVINEAVFLLQGESQDRAPESVELVIPEGTAERVARGEPVPSIPESMSFVLGDVLVVRNEDVVEHELGPLLIPPGTKASLPMDEADNLALSCSFQPTNYLGLAIREPTTWLTRLIAVFFAAPPTAVMAFLYSLAARPIRARDGEEEATETAPAG